MNDMHKLLLKVDSLTYNAMQVLNALIRSAVASGSSSGYKVVKYGNELVLSRSDIYRLNNFYELWEEAGFPSDEKTFNKMLGEADVRWRKPGEMTTLATDVVVKHAQILFMNEQDSNKVGDGDSGYWTDKVRTSGTPKATVGTAPIPINLRTPIYDENLSTKSFSQYETYLFPIGYRRAEILGTPGNGDDYVAGGANWFIDASEMLSLKGNHIVMGNVAHPQNRIDNYEVSSNTISWGLNSYAVRDNSLAFGVNSAAVADNSIVFGEQCVGNGKGSAIVGGYNCVTVGAKSFSSNDGTRTVGNASFAANHNTVAGSWTYSFGFPAVAERTEIDCDIVKTTEGVCLGIDSNAATTVANYSIIRVDRTEVEYSGLPDLDIKVGDLVAVYNTRYRVGNMEVGPVGLTGYSRDAFYTTVMSVTEVKSNNYTVAYDIGLADPIPVGNSKYIPLTGGYVTTARRDIKLYDADNKVVGTKSLLIGNCSASFGESTVARGESQAVFGEMNVPNDYARMIVGVGSYISDDYHSRFRANGLLVSDYYSYMKLYNGASVVGVSAGAYRVPDEEHVKLEEGAFLKSSYIGFGESRVIATGRTASLSATDDEYTPVGRIVVTNHPLLLGSSQYTTTEVTAYRGCAVISSGSYISGNANAGELIDALIVQSSVIGGADEHAVAIYAQDGIDIRNTENTNGRGINIETCSYLTLSCKGLNIHGDTYGSLTASDSARSFALKGRPGATNGKTGCQDDILYAHTVGRSGFYCGKIGDDFSVYGSDGWDGLAAHIISSAYYDETSKNYNVASIAIPSSISIDGDTARPVVSAGEIKAPGNNNQIGNVYAKELAYLEDTNGWCMAPMAGYGYRYTGMSTPPSEYMVPPSSGYRNIYPAGVYNNASHTWNTGLLYAEVTPINTSLDTRFAELAQTHAFTYKVKYVDAVLYELVMNFSLSGNHLDLVVHGIAGPDLSTLSGYSHLRVPALIGCAVSNSDNMPGSILWKYSMEPPASNIYTQMIINTKMSGTSYYSYVEPTYRFSANALQNGIIVMDITPVSSWNGGFMAQFSGMVPFEADSRCRHGKINGEWQRAMIEAYSGKIVMPYNELRMFLSDTLHN